MVIVVVRQTKWGIVWHLAVGGTSQCDITAVTAAPVAVCAVAVVADPVVVIAAVAVVVPIVVAVIDSIENRIWV